MFWIDAQRVVACRYQPLVVGDRLGVKVSTGRDAFSTDGDCGGRRIAPCEETMPIPALLRVRKLVHVGGQYLLIRADLSGHCNPLEFVL